MADLATTPATFAKMLQSAKGGDVLRLAGGPYSAVRVKTGVTDKGGVVEIRAADPASPPVFTNGLTIDKWVGVSLVGLNYDMSNASAGHALAINVMGGKKLSFIGGEIVGRNTGADRWGYGIGVGDVEGLTIAEMKLQTLRRGLIVGRCQDVLIIDNDISDLGTDAIDLGSVLRAKVIGNLLSGFNPVNDDHPDGIQVMCPTGSTPSEDVEIFDNAIVAGKGRRPQGIFVKSETLVPHRRIRIFDNLVINAAYHAITLTDAVDSVLKDNRALFQQGEAAKPDKSWIMVEDATGVWQNNESVALLNIPQTNGNKLIKPATDEEVAAALKGWMAKHRPAPAPEPGPGPEVITIYVEAGKTYLLDVRAK